MAFVSCMSCHWGQDDFWQQDGYTPFRQDTIDDLRSNLFKDRVHFDVGFFRTHESELKPEGHDEKGPWVRGTTLVAWDLRHRAQRVENMHWRTEEEWRKDPNQWVCPKCGGSLSID